MSIHDLFENSEEDAYIDAVRSGADWKAISEILARRLVRGPKGGISPCPDQRTREACFKRSPTPPTERVCVPCLIEHARKTLRKRK